MIQKLTDLILKLEIRALKIGIINLCTAYKLFEKIVKIYKKQKSEIPRIVMNLKR